MSHFVNCDNRYAWFAYVRIGLNLAPFEPERFCYIPGRKGNENPRPGFYTEAGTVACASSD
jgi:hypothetical protein